MASGAPADRRPSSIAGHGLFAVADHHAGDVVAVADDALNHSCDPNLGWTSTRTLAARRDIAAGEELTIDYATANSDAAWTMYCHCETYRCRQMIEGTDWRIPQLQQRYAGQWAPDVQRLIDSL